MPASICSWITPEVTSRTTCSNCSCVAAPVSIWEMVRRRLGPSEVGGSFGWFPITVVSKKSSYLADIVTGYSRPYWQSVQPQTTCDNRRDMLES